MEASETARSEIILDLSRLLSRASIAAPTGIDRVEMAYARGFLSAAPDRLSFAAVHPMGLYGRIHRRSALRFLDKLETCWDRGSTDLIDRMNAAGALATLLPLPTPRPALGAQRIYVLASHKNLTRPNLVRGILRRERAKLLCLVHDLIPIEYPEYARPQSLEEHKLRMKTIATSADMIVANSHATMRAMKPWIDRSGRTPAQAVAHLGTHIYAMADSEPAARRPYFLCVGTIEPRKNHLLLLNIWRRMAEERGAANVPKLLLVGRRGWENEQVVDMLERCNALRDCVEELGGLSDRDVGQLMIGARALLLPSFAEGYGMPVSEALAAGTPVICSDLPALREAGGAVPEFLDPLDGPGWIAAIRDYSDRSSRRAAAQRERIKEWTSPDWTQHIAILLNMMQSPSA